MRQSERPHPLTRHPQRLLPHAVRRQPAVHAAVRQPGQPRLDREGQQREPRRRRQHGRLLQRGRCTAAPRRARRLITFHPQISSIQDDLRTYNDNVSRIADLHNRSLNNTDDAAAERLTQQLEDLVADTSALSSVLKRRIKALEKQPGSGRDGQIRKQQV